MNKEEKKDLRKIILNKRNSIDNNTKEEMDREIFNKLINLDLYKEAKNIFIYLSFGSEIDTKPIIDRALEEGKEVYIPKVYKINKEMRAIRLNTFEDLEKNSMGILEPKDDFNFIAKEKIDLIIVPGAVFDFKGNRIGYGGGYYDRFLSNIKDKRNKIVLAYNLQIVDNIEAEEHDIKVDYIITNSRINKIY
ncbi:MAG: 5-formyltetrahydrofolate cyclo-ligase [Clostridium sp.]|nr:5-formyltetrahydrofolate cyclo-ligase [Clostridium sp.]MBS5950835.1 5-formyltetrahydrofolate cyclo-ligase [Clostridium sp.]